MRHLLLLLLLACSADAITPAPSNTTPIAARPIAMAVPTDLAASWQIGSAEVGAGGRISITLAPASAGTWTLTTIDEHGTRTRSLRAADLAALHAKLGSFFGLDPEHRDPDVRDGYASSLTVIASGRRHTVRVSNISVAPYAAVVLALRELSS